MFSSDSPDTNFIPQNVLLIKDNYWLLKLWTLASPWLIVSQCLGYVLSVLFIRIGHKMSADMQVRPGPFLSLYLIFGSLSRTFSIASDLCLIYAFSCNSMILGSKYLYTKSTEGSALQIFCGLSPIEKMIFQVLTTFAFSCQCDSCAC
jgi:hypothetical protein